jgi:hypothetical protein
MIAPLSPDWYRIVIRKETVLGEALYEGRAAELPDVVVYGTSEDAVRTDVRYELDRLRAAFGADRTSQSEPKVQ